MADEFGPLLRDLYDGDVATLRAFLAQLVPESPWLEYKREPPLDLADVVAAMANTEGGTIIVGVEEDKARKTPIDVGGWSAGDPKGQITGLLRSVLDPVPTHEVALIEGDPTSSGQARNYAVILVHPSAHRVVLHREKGLRVRVGDQCSAPTRFDFERLMLRESSRTEDVRAAMNDVAGVAALNAHPGAAQDQLFIYVVLHPLEAQDVQLDDEMDRAFRRSAQELLALAFQVQTGPDFTQLETATTDWVRLDRRGRISTRLVVPLIGGSAVPAVFAYDLICLLTAAALIPFALAETEPRLRWTSFVAAMAVGGYQGKTLQFARRGPPLDRRPDDDSSMVLIRSGVVSTASDVLPLTQQLVIDFARARQITGTDTWRNGLAGRLGLEYEPLRAWTGKLG